MRPLLQVFQAPDALQDSDHTGVLQMAAFVFTALYVSGIGRIDQCSVEIAFGC